MKKKDIILILIMIVFFLFHMTSIDLFYPNGYEDNRPLTNAAFKNVIGVEQNIILLQRQERKDGEPTRVLSDLHLFNKRILSDVYGFLRQAHYILHPRIIDHRDAKIRLLTMLFHGSRYKGSTLFI